MRKRLLAALLVLIMLVSIMPLAVSAEEECTEHAFVQDDYYGHVCESCGTYEDHVDADGDCVCDVCGGACHGLYGWYGPDSDEDGHWYICDKCGEVVDYEAHADNYTYTYTWEANSDGYSFTCYSSCVEAGDGICDNCRYGCSHTNTVVTFNDDTHIEYCVSCGDILQWGCVDADNDCICDIYGEEYHNCFYFEPYESGHAYVCGNCGKEFDFSAHVDELATTYTYTAIDSGYYISWVTEDGSDGICDICGYGCQHANTAIATGSSYCFEYCTNCAEILDYLCEDEDGDCVCDVGGHEVHSYSFFVDENNHGYVCSKCGKVLVSEAHYDNYTYHYSAAGDTSEEGADGVCDACGYGCTHPDYYRMGNTYYGEYCRCEGYCTTCGEFIGFVGVDADGDGVCDVCGGIMWDSGTVTTSTSGTVASSVTVDTSALLTEDDAWLIASGYDVEIVLSVDEMTSSADSTLILSAAGNNVVGVSYLDIGLTKMTYDANGAVYDQEALTDLSTPVTITVAIPQSLLDSVGTTTGTYSVVRVHDGVATVLATSYDSTAKTVTFTTDRFSTYGIVFTASTNTNTGLDPVPQTGDSSLILVGIALLMAAAPVVKKFVF